MTEKKWEDLTIRDNFIFGKVMETSPSLCKRLLEKILHIQIKELSYPEREKPIEVRHDSKSIRLDLLVQERGDTSTPFIPSAKRTAPSGWRTEQPRFS